MMNMLNINGQLNGRQKKLIIQIHKDGNMPINSILNFPKMINLNMSEEENGLDMQIKYNENYILIFI